MLQLAPDYTKVGTSEEIEKELSEFKITGPGWYLTNTGSILVQVRKEDDDTRWHAKQPPDSVFVVHVWNCRLSGTIFGQSLPPTRVDERD